MKNNLIKVGILIIVSQLLIVAFSVHWLHGQYQEEKDLLREETARYLSESKLQVTDSMLMIHLINPILQGNKDFKLRIAVSKEEDIVMDSIRSKKINRSMSFFKPSDSLPTGDSDSLTNHNQFEFTSENDSSGNLLMQGVKLIYQEVTSSMEHPDQAEHAFLNSDTILLKEVFADKMSKAGLDIPYKWGIVAELRKDSSDEEVIFLESKVSDEGYGVVLSGFRTLLMKEIIPQIIFALVLVIVSASAFYFSYRGLKKQTRLNLLKSDFISNISHELKTPVSTVKVAVEALQDPVNIKDPDKIKDYLSMASQEINRLDLLIQKVLDSSARDGNKSFLQRESLSPSLLIQDVIRSQKHRLELAGAKIQFKGSDPETMISIDRLHTEGVLLNLIDNSIKYSDKDPEISIDVEETGDEVWIGFEDNGPGIDPQYLKNIFDRFFRVPGKNIHNVKGSGLGLSYVKLVMDQHKGSVSVQNLQAGGLRFTLKFPKT